MNDKQKEPSVSEAERMTPNQVLAEGWRLTEAILALKGMEIPYTIEFQIDGGTQVHATRVATLDVLARGVASLDEAIAQRSEHKPSDTGPYRHLTTEQLKKDRDALLELQKRTGQGGDLASTTVIEALFPDVPVKKKTADEKIEIEKWLAIRKEEALRIDPETAEVEWRYAQTLDPYGVFDEWELPEEFDQMGREYFARAPGSDIWVAFRDLPVETREKLWNRHRRVPASFPARLGLCDVSDEEDGDDDVPF
jgi:hypothetical protein